MLRQAPVKHIEIPVRISGYSHLDKYKVIKNKLTANFGKAMYGVLTGSSVTIKSLDGYDLTLDLSKSPIPASYSNVVGGMMIMFLYGTGQQAVNINVYKLASEVTRLISPGIDIVEENEYTSIIFRGLYEHWSDETITEYGLGIQHSYYQIHRYMFSYTVLDTPQTRSASTIYRDAHEIRFGNGFTKWFVRALAGAYLCEFVRDARFLPVRLSDGSYRNIQTEHIFKGISRMAIGTGNTPFTPNDYKLENEIYSSSAVAKTYVVDTENDIVSIKLSISYTPDTNVDIYEIGFFNNVLTRISTLTETKEIMTIRKVLDTPLSLSAGVTYDISLRIDIG